MSARVVASSAGARTEVVRLYIFRHGVSEWNLLRKWQGVQDTQLAAEGETPAVHKFRLPVHQLIKRLIFAARDRTGGGSGGEACCEWAALPACSIVGSVSRQADGRDSKRCLQLQQGRCWNSGGQAGPAIARVQPRQV